MQTKANVGIKAGLLNTIAKWISRVLNPFGASVATLLAITYVGANNLPAFSKWVSIILFFAVVLPLTYVYIKSPRVGSEIKKIQDPFSFFRIHRKEASVIAIACGLPGLLLLIFLNAPSLMVATLVALIGTSLGIGLINLRFKASYHLALITTLVILTVATWERTFPYVLAVIPLVGCSRYLLKQHSPSQLAAGFGLSVVVGFTTLHLFGLIGQGILH